MRLFIAIDLTEGIKEYLKLIQKALSKDAKLNLAKDFHLTLKFLGEVSEKQIGKLKEDLSKIDFEPFRLKLNKIWVFPNKSCIKVVWVDVAPGEKVIRLQQKIENALLGIFPKDAGFSPHITLARVKFITDKKAFIDELKNIKVEAKEFDVQEFKLIKSALTRAGPIYEHILNFKSKAL